MHLPETNPLPFIRIIIGFVRVTMWPCIIVSQINCVLFYCFAMANACFAIAMYILIELCCQLMKLKKFLPKPKKLLPRPSQRWHQFRAPHGLCLGADSSLIAVNEDFTSNPRART